MKLFIVRHGDTLHLRQNILMGWMGSELTDEGIKQAKELARQLSRRKIDLIFSSDLNRTKQTAEIISKTLGGVPIIYDWLLRERSHGVLDGKSKNDLDWEKLNIENSENQALGIEPLSHLNMRGKTFIENLKLLQVKAENIVVVTHDGLGNSILLALDNSHGYQTIGHSEIIEKEASYYESSKRDTQ